MSDKELSLKSQTTSETQPLKLEGNPFLTPSTHSLSQAERQESVKAGLVGAGVGMPMVVSLTALNGELGALKPVLFNPIAITDWQCTIVGNAIALFSCFLFGVTYRYIIRQDANPHLRSGAVGAFALVRGLAQLEAIWQTSSWLVWLTLLSESFVLFAGVQLVLNWAIAQGWVKSFQG